MRFVFHVSSPMEHPCILAEHIGDLLFDDKTADVILIVGGESIPAHRAILAARSPYFRALLFGSMKESLQSKVTLKGIPLRGFKLLMSYVYTGQWNQDEIDVEVLLEMLEPAHLYGFDNLQVMLVEHLGRGLDFENVCAVFNTAHRFQLKGLLDVCHRKIIKDPIAVLKSAAFCDLSGAALSSIISDDTFCAEEIEIFAAVARWRTKLLAEEICSSVFEKIRLPLIDSKDLMSTVLASNLIPRDAILSAIRTKECHPADLRYRAPMISGVNLASPDCGAHELEKYLSEDHFAAETCSMYREKALPAFPSEITINKEGLTVALREPFLINHIAFRLPVRKANSYNIEISMDSKVWIRIIDHGECSCESFQNLFFETRPARFIRLICTGKVDMTISAFEVTHVVEPFKLIGGFYAPEKNVASGALGTRFRIKRRKAESEHEELEQHEEGEGEYDEEEEEFVSEDEESYEDEEDEDEHEDEDEEDEESALAESSERMTHEIGNEFIVIIFPQPYVVDSMRMFLRDDHSRAYKYYIETSMDYRKWRRVADNTAYCRSWQRITFDAHPVIFMRIVGTASSLDNHFSFSHFECPAPEESSSHGPQESIGQGSV